MDFCQTKILGRTSSYYSPRKRKNIALEDKDLPLILPVLKDYKGKNGKAPLDNDINWKMLLLMESKVKEKHRQCLARQVHHGTI